MPDPYETLDSVITHRGAIVDVKLDTITLPDGKRAKRETVLRGEAAAVLPVDSDGNAVLVKQYRHSVGKTVIEIPAGVVDSNDADPKHCALRELREETGYSAGGINHITSMHTAIGFCNEVVHIYEAWDLTPGETDFDEGEFIEIVKIPVDDAVAMIFTGEITDSKTIAALLAYGRRDY